MYARTLAAVAALLSSSQLFQPTSVPREKLRKEWHVATRRPHRRQLSVSRSARAPEGRQPFGWIPRSPVHGSIPSKLRASNKKRGGSSMMKSMSTVSRGWRGATYEHT